MVSEPVALIAGSAVSPAKEAVIADACVPGVRDLRQTVSMATPDALVLPWPTTTPFTMKVIFLLARGLPLGSRRVADSETRLPVTAVAGATVSVSLEAGIGVGGGFGGGGT